MVKTHKVTGLKYLCKTIRSDYIKYQGSGIYWRKHLKIHGNLVDTEVLMILDTDEELKKWGLYYSELWNIVNDVDENGKKTWANEKPESGDGAASGKYHHSSDKTIYTFYHDDGRVEVCSRSELQSKYGLHRGAVSSILRGEYHTVNGWRITEAKQKWKISQVAEKNNNYDKNIYSFIHDDGRTEDCTAYDLRTKYNLNAGSVSGVINGNQHRVGGWRLVK
jgi:hypothetical protein